MSFRQYTYRPAIPSAIDPNEVQTWRQYQSHLAYLGDGWRDLAKCNKSNCDLFFHVDDDSDTTAKAIAICSSCPVQDKCLEHALVNREEDNVWGGTTPKKRRWLYREMRKAGGEVREHHKWRQIDAPGAEGPNLICRVRKFMEVFLEINDSLHTDHEEQISA